MRSFVFIIPDVYRPKHHRPTGATFTPDAEMIARMVERERRA